MDVTGWPLEQRMMLPDWCFGARSTDGVYLICPVSAVKYWGISNIVLPDPVCVWSVGWFVSVVATGELLIRVGFRATVPTSEAEMDEAVEILPGIGVPMTGPSVIRVVTPHNLGTMIHFRKGIATTGLKLVVQIQHTKVPGHVSFFMVYSALPTLIPAW